MNSAASTGVVLSDYNLPTGFEELKKESKTINSKNDNRFRLLFKALNKNGAVNIKRLSVWIKYLKETNYKADINVLKGL
ncbi:MAG: hypothetical protein M3015_05890 [Bacteroidota bacterium]|nr:hypothetical protein [Bacteroidota bacterium]